jgi:hypothetical protein
MTARRVRVVNDYLGNDYLLSPEDLRWRLLYAGMLDKSGFITHKFDLGLRPVTPSYFKRKVMWVNPRARDLLAKYGSRLPRSHRTPSSDRRQ